MAGCKSPSKFLSLAFLKEVQAHYYMSAGGINYEAFEVDMLIIEKEEKIATEEVWTDEDFADVIPFPVDADFAAVEQDEIIPSSILNRLFNKLTRAFRKASNGSKEAQTKESKNYNFVRQIFVRLLERTKEQIENHRAGRGSLYRECFEKGGYLMSKMKKEKDFKRGGDSWCSDRHREVHQIPKKCPRCDAWMTRTEAGHGCKNCYWSVGND